MLTLQGVKTLIIIGHSFLNFFNGNKTHQPSTTSRWIESSITKLMSIMPSVWNLNECRKPSLLRIHLHKDFGGLLSHIPPWAQVAFQSRSNPRSWKELAGGTMSSNGRWAKTWCSRIWSGKTLHQAGSRVRSRGLDLSSSNSHGNHLFLEGVYILRDILIPSLQITEGLYVYEITASLGFGSPILIPFTYNEVPPKSNSCGKTSFESNHQFASDVPSKSNPCGRTSFESVCKRH